MRDRSFACASIVATAIFAASPAAPAEIHCGADAGCPLIDLETFDPVDPDSSLRGFADPSLEKDPWSDAVYLAYSKPHRSSATGNAQIETHLAVTLDHGQSWSAVVGGGLDGTLWALETGAPNYVHGPGAGFAGVGEWSFETPNLLAITTGPAASVWIGARMIEFRDDLHDVEPTSFGVRVSRAYSAPGLATNADGLDLIETLDLVGSAGAQVGYAWQVRESGPSDDIPYRDLSLLAPELGNCAQWIEPSLYYDAASHDLFIAMRCQAYVGNLFDPQQSGIFVFVVAGDAGSNATTVPASAWTISYVGSIVDGTNVDALLADLDPTAPLFPGDPGFPGYAPGLPTSLSQLDIAEFGGSLFGVLTPDDYQEAFGNNRKYGCRVVPLEPMATPGIRKVQGHYVLLAKLYQDPYSTNGQGSCALAPELGTEAAGVLLAKRTFSPGEVTSEIRDTGFNGLVWPIFFDGFESGNLNGWSTYVP
ncbi:MAG: hypothetical protein R2862_10615 [Thermoanaerobaculia bacterium]